MHRQKLNTTITNFLNESAELVELNHNGLAGHIREMLVSKILSPLLPDGYKIGTGKIINKEGLLSKQIDIIIYNRRVFPPILYDEATGVFPVESVYYTIEVKTTLTHDEIVDAIDKGRSIRKLNGPPVLNCLLAISSKIKNGIEDNLIEEKQQSEVIKPLNVYCILGSVYAYHDHKKWNIYRNTNNRNEFVGFIIGIVNTLSDQPNWKTDVKPGHYLFGKHDLPNQALHQSP